jgi:hypothetical protein
VLSSSIFALLCSSEHIHGLERSQPAGGCWKTSEDYDLFDDETLLNNAHLLLSMLKLKLDYMLRTKLDSYMLQTKLDILVLNLRVFNLPGQARFWASRTPLSSIVEDVLLASLASEKGRDCFSIRIGCGALKYERQCAESR